STRLERGLVSLTALELEVAVAGEVLVPHHGLGARVDHLVARDGEIHGRCVAVGEVDRVDLAHLDAGDADLVPGLQARDVGERGVVALVVTGTVLAEHHDPPDGDQAHAGCEDDQLDQRRPPPSGGSARRAHCGTSSMPSMTCRRVGGAGLPGSAGGSGPNSGLGREVDTSGMPSTGFEPVSVTTKGAWTCG